MVQVLRGMMTVADMTPGDGGPWLLHCHVNDDIVPGMLALYHGLLTFGLPRLH